MNCPFCEEELILGGSHDCEDVDGEFFLFVNNLSCPKCGCFVLAYYPRGEDGDETR